MRVLTLNIWQEQGPWQRRMEVIEQHLRLLTPDVICLQEVRQVEDRIPNQAKTLAQSLGYHWSYEVAQPWGGGDEGLAILARGPIHDSRVCELPFPAGQSRRICLAAEVEWAAGQRHWFFTTHLAYRLIDGAVRERQVRALDLFVREVATGPAVLCGDFNATPDSDEMRYLVGLTSLDGERTYYQDAYRSCHGDSPGWTWCAENPYIQALSTLPPDRRLDYIFVTPRTRAGAARILRCDLVCTEVAIDGTRCSDHYGLLAELALAAESRE